MDRRPSPTVAYLLEGPRATLGTARRVSSRRYRGFRSLERRVASPAIRPRVRHPRQILRLLGPSTHSGGRDSVADPSDPAAPSGEVPAAASFTSPAGGRSTSPSVTTSVTRSPRWLGGLGWSSISSGLRREINSTPDQFMLFGMWDPSAGDVPSPTRIRVHLYRSFTQTPTILRGSDCGGLRTASSTIDGSNFSRLGSFSDLSLGESSGDPRVALRNQGSRVPGRRIDHRDHHQLRPALIAPNVHWMELGIQRKRRIHCRSVPLIRTFVVGRLTASGPRRPPRPE